ncbi:glycosyltransferase family 4 protein [Vibrio europaeus]|uniref:glycosyltransferase family 4 protein n=1 Tax=Vibrio europaeus TaxID=300876 RepID=UPI00233F5055|nr:glycosyltransferase family 4 protein [Vibrio europaeus]MDC5855132.1 glycosyltransferase family 4 protein [Vibrio europaeus]
MVFLIVSNKADTLVNFRLDLIKDIQAQGKVVHACAPQLDESSPSGRLLTSIGVIVHPVPVSRTGLNPFFDTLTFVSLLRLVYQLRPDEILSYTIKPVIWGGLASALFRVKGRYSLITGVGYALANTQGGIKYRLVQSLARKLYKFALRYSHKVFFQNPDDLKLFRDLGIISSRTSARVVNGSGVNLELFTPSPLPQKTTFVFVGRLLFDKGIREFAIACKALKTKYPNAIFKIAGGLDVNPESISDMQIQSWVSEGFVEYLGEVKDIREVLADSSVIVLPSYREGVPRSVLEAMAMGRAVVTTDAPGCKETVVDGINGYLVTPRSAESLAIAMEKILQNPSILNSMGKASLNLAVERFDVRKVNKMMLKMMSGI